MSRAGEWTLLLVEDEPLRRALGRLLAWEGLRVVRGPTMEPDGPGLIVLDLGTGCVRRALARLRAWPAGEKLPLLVLGGDASAQDELRGRAGRTTMLPPLADGPQILAAVRTALAESYPPLASVDPEREQVQMPARAR